MVVFFFFKQKTAYEMRISDWSSDVCSSDLNAGHCRPEISEAIAKAAATLDFAPTFQLGHPLPFELAQRLADLMPPGLDRIFFTNSGSESVDTALKIEIGRASCRERVCQYV